jgi:hypothetical protein
MTEEDSNSSEKEESKSSGSSSGGSSDEMSNPLFGAILLFGGLLVFYLNDFVLSSGYAFTLNIILLIIATLAYKHKTFFLALTFIIWYFLMGATLDFYTFIISLIIASGIGVLGSIVIEGISSKNLVVGKTFFGALGFSFVFILQMGLINKLLVFLGYIPTETFVYLLASLPIWSLVGLFFLDQHQFRGRSLLNFLLISWVVLIVIGSIGFSTSDVSDSAEGFLERSLAAKQETEKGIDRFSGAKDTLSCVSNMVFNVADLEKESFQECGARRKRDRQLIASCNEILKDQAKEGSKVFNACIDDQKKENKDKSNSITGTVDPTLNQPMKVIINFLNKNFIYIEGSAIPIEIKVENPREVSLDVSIYCNITKGDEQIASIIEGNDKFTISNKKFNSIVLCKPFESDLKKGKYKVEAVTLIEGIEVESHQEKAFVGDFIKGEKLEKEIRESIRITKSQSASDLIHLIFSLNYGDDRNPMVFDPKDPENFQNLFLSAKLRNVGGGKIIDFKEYEIDLPGFVTTGSSNCFGQSNFKFSKKSREILLPSCIIEDFPNDLKPEDEDIWILKDLRARAVVDYEIKKEMGFTAEGDEDDSKEEGNK